MSQRFSPFRWFKTALKQEPPLTHKSANPFGYMAALGRHMQPAASWDSSEMSYEECVMRGYKRNATVFRCINLIADSLSAIDLELYQDGIKVHDHPLLDLMACPNPHQNHMAFFEAMVSHYLLCGNAFLEAASVPDPDEPNHTRMALYVLRPDRVFLNTDKRGYVSDYEYRTRTESRRIAKRALLHIKTFHPLDDHRGMSPLEPIKHILTYVEKNTANIVAIASKGRPWGVLKLNGDTLRPQEMEALQERVRQMEQSGYAQTIVLDGNFEWQNVGFSPKDMDFAEGRAWADRAIAQAFGIPPTILGLSNMTYENYDQALGDLWKSTLLPLMDFFLAHVNQWLVPLYGDTLRLGYQIDAIPAMVTRMANLYKASDVPILTINERRTLLGRPPIEGGDVLSGSHAPRSLISEQLHMQPGAGAVRVQPLSQRDDATRDGLSTSSSDV